MKAFSQLLSVRRSHRSFTATPLTEDEIRALLRSALIAPTSKGQHSCEFVCVTEPAKLHALSLCKDFGAAFLEEAPCAIVVLTSQETSDTWIEDGSVAATHILLQAEDLGLGACWVQVRNRHDANGTDAETNVKNIIAAPDNYRVLCIVGVGHKAAERKPQNEDKLMWDKIHYNTIKQS